MTEWHLQRRGEMDCKQQILRKGEDGIFMSPFMKQEIGLYSMNIQSELELHERILSRLKIEIEKEQLMLEQKAYIIIGIDLDQDSLESVTPIRLRGEETLTEDVLKFNRTSEAEARLLAKKRQIETLDMYMNMNSKKKQQFEYMVKKECAITSLRCKKLHDILCMRLSAYWSGALKDINHSKEIPPVYTIDHLIKEIKLQ